MGRGFAEQVARDRMADQALSNAETVAPTSRSKNGAPASAASEATTMATSTGTGAVQYIGGYRIKQLIATGGMGSVYLAEQENPRRTVALKVMKPGIVSPATLKRFEYESQVLGRLHHPNIAQVYEAGTHDDGEGSVPFFVMEFVPGAKTLREYADEKALKTNDKLELFLKICDAVHHGHQKGVIHRDLKPANILVGSSGEPKIIDFGVARATDADLAGATMQTEVGQLVGTVQYMSPEQVAADPHDIDTRSDVYALGVVLYELLTESFPYDLNKMPLYEATRIIREKPAIKLSTINSHLRGDLETVVMHALEKDPDRRYQSAAGLAEDLRRYLERRPVQAQPPTTLYLMKTYARRNKALVLGIAGVFFALVGGIIGTTYQMVRANENARQALLESDQNAEGNDFFFNEMILALDPREGVGKDAKISDVLNRAALSVDQKEWNFPETKAFLLWSIGKANKEISDFGKAQIYLNRALELQRQTIGPDHPDIATTLLDLGSVYWWLEDQEKAEPLFIECLEMRRRLFEGDHEEVANAMNYLAASYRRQDRFDDAEPLYRDAMAMRKRVHGEYSELYARSLNNFATYMKSRAKAFSDAGDTQRAHDYFAQALEHYTQATKTVDLVSSKDGKTHIDVGGGKSNQAECHIEMAKIDNRLGRSPKALAHLKQAENLLEDSLEIKSSLLADDHVSLARTVHSLADCLHLLNSIEPKPDRPVHAQQYCERALEIRRSNYPESHARVIESRELLEEIAPNSPYIEPPDSSLAGSGAEAG